jgi:hypothetical protein
MEGVVCKDQTFVGRKVDVCHASALLAFSGLFDGCTVLASDFTHPLRDYDLLLFVTFYFYFLLGLSFLILHSSEDYLCFSICYVTIPFCTFASGYLGMRWKCACFIPLGWCVNACAEGLLND